MTKAFSLLRHMLNRNSGNSPRSEVFVPPVKVSRAKFICEISRPVQAFCRRGHGVFSCIMSSKSINWNVIQISLMFLCDRPKDQMIKYHNILNHIPHYYIQYRDFHIALLSGWPAAQQTYQIMCTLMSPNRTLENIASLSKGHKIHIWQKWGIVLYKFWPLQNQLR